MQDTDLNHAAGIRRFLADFKASVERQEAHRSRAEIVAGLEAQRTLAAQSPLLRSAQTWTRGYAGDFEIINYIIRGESGATPDTPGYWLDAFFLQSDICRQHRNKVACQSRIIRDTLRRNPDAHIISIGSGTSEDVKNNIPQILAGGAQVTLVDIDGEALAYSCRQLQNISDRVVTHQGNIYKIMRSLTERYDLVLIGGVFDYLQDKVIIAILRTFKNNLADQGRLFFTNINVGNPYRIFMEYLADWILIERSAVHLHRLVAAAGWSAQHVTIQKDDTGLAHMVTLGSS